jgi:hypothetical protein
LALEREGEGKKAMATSFKGTTTKCTACDKTVYLVDKLTADNRVYHKACFRCHHCKGTLKVCKNSVIELYYVIVHIYTQRKVALGLLCVAIMAFFFLKRGEMMYYVVIKSRNLPAVCFTVLHCCSLRITIPSRECSTAGLTSTSSSRGPGAWTRVSKV